MYQHLHRVFRAAPQGNVTIDSRKPHTAPGFTIVELLVVIVIIGILAAITIVAYTGISQKAVASSLQADLTNASTKLKIFQVDNSAYPTANNCPTPGATEICLKLSSGNTLVGYSASNQSGLQTFLLIVSNNGLAYKVTNNTAPTQLASTMQPGVTPGAILELHAAKANNGTGPGINSPLTTTWKDTSGNGNHGTLNGFSGTPWAGAGTPSDPYALRNPDRISARVVDVTPSASLPGDLFHGDAWTVEAWVNLDDAAGGVLLMGIWHQPWIRIYGSGLSLVGFNEAYEFVTMVTASTSSLVGAWHHILISQDVPGGYVRIFVNGVQLAETTPTRFFAGGAGSFVWMGLNAADNVLGSLAVARIYPFALTPAQVSANYNAGSDW